MIISNAKIGNMIPFPAFQGERIYMLPFTKKDGFSAVPLRWRNSVAEMMAEGDTDLLAYLMVDQKRLAPLEYHRRGGIHVDGNWCPATNMWDNPPTHSHAGRHDHMHGEYKKETILLASNIEACKAYLGEVSDKPKEDGDCSHFDLNGLSSLVMKRNHVYHCSATTLHETIPVKSHCERTVLRINIPGF